MKRVLFAAMAALALTTAAFAGDELMASRFGNTTIVTTTTGVVIKIWYNADHTWSGTMGSAPSAGTWKLDGTQLCVTYDNPPPGVTNPTCSEAQDRKVGDHWSVGDGAGKLDVTLVAGKQ